MRILILGASGKTGRLAVEEALHRGHTVTVIVRRRPSWPLNGKIHIIEGTPLDNQTIVSAFTAIPNDRIAAVVSCLDGGRTTTSLEDPDLRDPPTIMATAMQNVLAAMRTHDVHTLVVLSAFGVATSYPYTGLLLHLYFHRTNLLYTFADHESVHAQLMASQGIDWTEVRAVGLTEGDKAPVKVWGNDGNERGVGYSISRKSVAGFMLDAVDRGSELRTPVISN